MTEPFSIIFKQDLLLITAVLESPGDIEDFNHAFGMAARAFGQAIEARRAATVEQGAVHESAVGETDAPQGGPNE